MPRKDPNPFFVLLIAGILITAIWLFSLEPKSPTPPPVLQAEPAAPSPKPQSQPSAWFAWSTKDGQHHSIQTYEQTRAHATVFCTRRNPQAKILLGPAAKSNRTQIVPGEIRIGQGPRTEIHALQIEGQTTVMLLANPEEEAELLRRMRKGRIMRFHLKDGSRGYKQVSLMGFTRASQKLAGKCQMPKERPPEAKQKPALAKDTHSEDEFCSIFLRQNSVREGKIQLGPFDWPRSREQAVCKQIYQNRQEGRLALQAGDLEKVEKLNQEIIRQFDAARRRGMLRREAGGAARLSEQAALAGAAILAGPLWPAVAAIQILREPRPVDPDAWPAFRECAKGANHQEWKQCKAELNRSNTRYEMAYLHQREARKTKSEAAFCKKELDYAGIPKRFTSRLLAANGHHPKAPVDERNPEFQRARWACGRYYRLVQGGKATPTEIKAAQSRYVKTMMEAQQDTNRALRDALAAAEEEMR